MAGPLAALLMSKGVEQAQKLSGANKKPIESHRKPHLTEASAKSSVPFGKMRKIILLNVAL